MAGKDAARAVEANLFACWAIELFIGITMKNMAAKAAPTA